MNLTNLSSKIANKADLLGVLAGLWTGTGAGFTDWISSAQQLMAGVIHAPNFMVLQAHIQSPQIMNSIALYVGGLLAEEFNVPIVGKYGKALQKGAVAYAATSIAGTLLYSATHSPIKGTNIEQNFRNAPTVAQLNPYSY